MRKSIIFATAVLTYAAAAQAENVSIACEGVANGSETVGFNANNMPLSAPTSSAAGVVFVLNGGEAKIRLSSTLWQSGGDGWFPVSEIQISETTIKGRVTLSPLTKPRLRIDRISGSIDLSSSSLIGTSFSFSGACVPLDMRRKF